VIVLFFALGLAFGSFVNALAFRLKNDRPVIFGRSFCPKCGHPLSWWQLIPLFSFLVLSGRCYYCKASISWHYPAVEFIAGISLAMLIWQKHYLLDMPLLLIFSLLIIVLLIFIALYDWRELQILDLSVALGLILALAVRFLTFDIVISFVAAAALTVLFAGIYFISRGRWIGFGDVKLAVFLGLLSGPLTPLMLILASVLGLLVGLYKIIFKGGNLRTKLPFGTFLAASALFIFIFESEISNFIFRNLY